MANQLFPTVAIPSLTKTKKNVDYRYKRSAAWDPATGDFIRDGAGKIVEHSGRDAYMIWCMKTSLTERYAKLAYPHSIGSELEDAKHEQSPSAVELALERTLTEAIMVNPRTEYVRDFAFLWRGENLKVTFKVKGYDLEEFQIEL